VEDALFAFTEETGHISSLLKSMPGTMQVIPGDTGKKKSILKPLHLQKHLMKCGGLWNGLTIRYLAAKKMEKLLCKAPECETPAQRPGN
jgi:hypothetical protein